MLPRGGLTFGCAHGSAWGSCTGLGPGETRGLAEWCAALPLLLALIPKLQIDQHKGHTEHSQGAATTCPCLCPTQVSTVGYGMDEVEQDQHEARLKELFDSFDTTGTGSLGQEELTDLCHMLSLEEVAPVLQETLLQDNLLGRVRPGAVGSGGGFCRGAAGEAHHTHCMSCLTSRLCVPLALMWYIDGV